MENFIQYVHLLKNTSEWSDALLCKKVLDKLSFSKLIRTI